MGTLLYKRITPETLKSKLHMSTPISLYVLSMNTQLLKVNFEIDLRLFEQSKVQSTPRWWRLCPKKKGGFPKNTALKNVSNPTTADGDKYL